MEGLTKSQREFIGTEFPTPKGGVLTVTGVVGRRDSNAIFGLECSICSLDTELWFKGKIRSLKCDLTRGGIPCGCAKSPKWTEDQTKIRVERECNKRGYIFHGWSGEYKGKATHLDLENQKTGNRWKSTTIHNFMQGGGDPEERKEKLKQSRLIEDETHIKEFMSTGKFLEGTKFWRSNKKSSKGHQPYWNYSCPDCSSDAHVKAGVCSGVFEANMGKLKLGQLSCRCTDKYLWTQKQREYQITKALSTEGGRFIDWCEGGGYKNYRSKFKWECREGHSCETSVDNLINQNNRCSTCNKIRQKEDGRTYGYYPHRKDEQDNLYLIDFKSQGCIKVGRAFDVDKRIPQLLKQSGCTRDEIEILQVLSGTHQEVYETEQWIHSELTERGFYHETSTWSVETFDEDCEHLLYSLVDQSGLTPAEW